jgi:hypothetical protein
MNHTTQTAALIEVPCDSGRWRVHSSSCLLRHARVWFTVLRTLQRPLKLRLQGSHTDIAPQQTYCNNRSTVRSLFPALYLVYDERFLAWFCFAFCVTFRVSIFAKVFDFSDSSLTVLRCPSHTRASDISWSQQLTMNLSLTLLFLACILALSYGAKAPKKDDKMTNYMKR